MKKFLLGLVLAATAATADANYFLNTNDGLWYGNVCRTGLYFSVVAFAPIGSGCWNYGWNMSGVISGS